MRFAAKFVLVAALLVLLLGPGAIVFGDSPFGQSKPAAQVVAPVFVEPFIPSYERVEAYGPSWYFEEALRKLGVNRPRRYVNPMLFADARTAAWALKTFGGVAIIEKVALGNEGPFYTLSAKQRWIVLADKREFNAGQAATLFIQNCGYNWKTDTPGVISWYRTGGLSNLDPTPNAVKYVWDNLIPKARR